MRQFCCTASFYLQIRSDSLMLHRSKVRGVSLLATPRKSRSSKAGPRPATSVARSPAKNDVSKPVAKPTGEKVAAAAPMPVKAPVTPKAPVARKPVAAAAPKAAPATATVVRKPVDVPAVKTPVEWPVSAAAKAEAVDASPAPLSPVSNPELADAFPLPDTGKSAAAKGEPTMTDMMDTAKTYAEEAKTRMQSAFTEMNEKTKAAMEKSGRAFEELGELTRGNLEAMVESSKIAAKGMETLGQDAAEFGRKSFEKSSATMKSFASIKSPAEFFQLQSELLSQTMDSFASEAAKNSEKMLKLVSDISQPISNRVSVVTEKVKSIAA
ncbi:phasin family protein [Sphingobium sp. B8D3D]|uniref:phasin family protein n=1 Tax=Sphingobium sp. B8D3D TaxID=2940587 RepID=UPI00222596F0|nr:phasin family protein [Sphingobium sp. B8D3D]